MYLIVNDQKGKALSKYTSDTVCLRKSYDQQKVSKNKNTSLPARLPIGESSVHVWSEDFCRTLPRWPICMY